MQRECNIHGMTEHHPRSDGGHRCGKCASAAVSKRRKNLKQESVKYKGGACLRCGYDKCIDALEFHHRDPSKKDFGIGTTGVTRSFERIKVELDQCDLLCANCHREEHASC